MEDWDEKLNIGIACGCISNKMCFDNEKDLTIAQSFNRRHE